MVSDNIYAKAKVPNDTGKVGLWLGANVMVEYTFQEAIALLTKNLKNAQLKIDEADSDIDRHEERFLARIADMLDFDITQIRGG